MQFEIRFRRPAIVGDGASGLSHYNLKLLFVLSSWHLVADVLKCGVRVWRPVSLAERVVGWRGVSRGVGGAVEYTLGFALPFLAVGHFNSDSVQEQESSCISKEGRPKGASRGQHSPVTTFRLLTSVSFFPLPCHASHPLNLPLGRSSHHFHPCHYLRSRVSILHHNS